MADAGHDAEWAHCMAREALRDSHVDPAENRAVDGQAADGVLSKAYVSTTSLTVCLRIISIMAVRSMGLVR